MKGGLGFSFEDGYLVLRSATEMTDDGYLRCVLSRRRVRGDDGTSEIVEEIAYELKPLQKIANVGVGNGDVVDLIWAQSRNGLAVCFQTPRRPYPPLNKETPA